MPLHEYTCKKCGLTFEELVTSSMQVLCPGCAGKRLQKLVSAPRAPGKSAGTIARGRARAAAEGHLSHYKRSNGRIID